MNKKTIRKANERIITQQSLLPSCLKLLPPHLPDEQLPIVTEVKIVNCFFTVSRRERHRCHPCEKTLLHTQPLSKKEPQLPLLWQNLSYLKTSNEYCLPCMVLEYGSRHSSLPATAVVWSREIEKN